jgi:fluoroquinolone resistance protein
VIFSECKMLGLRFDSCSEFGLAFAFKNCVLNHASFYRVKIKKTTFKDCQIQEADFTQTDLSGSIFDNCDLSNATFDNTILEKCDFRSAFNYMLNPEFNRIKKAKFSLQGLPGLLNSYDIDIES